MDGRDIEALDAQGRHRQRKSALQLQKRLIGAVVGIPGAHHVAHERVSGVSLGSLEQTMLLATLRAMHAAHAASSLGKPCPDELSVRKLACHVHLGGNVRGLIVIALDEASDELLLRYIEPLVQDEFAASLHSTVAHHEDAGPRDGLLAEEPDHIDVDARGEDHLLAIIEPVDDLEPPLDAARALEIELFGGTPHLAGKLIDHLTPAAREEPLDAPHIVSIILRRYGAHAGAGAAPNVVIEARASMLRAHKVDHVALVFVRLNEPSRALPLRAGRDADRNNLADRVDGLARGTAIGIRAEIARAGLVLLTRVLDGGVHIAFGDGDEGIALIVFEVDVEVGPILADELALQDERLVLGIHHQVIEALHELHHEGNLGAVVGQGHILAHARTQVLALPT